jgi:hypothetical protein
LGKRATDIGKRGHRNRKKGPQILRKRATERGKNGHRYREKGPQI